MGHMPAWLRQVAALPEIAGRTGRDDVLPGRFSAAAARNDMVECQVLLRSAILALEFVAQEDVEAREGRIARRADIGLERNDARKRIEKDGEETW